MPAHLIAGTSKGPPETLLPCARDTGLSGQVKAFCARFKDGFLQPAGRGGLQPSSEPGNVAVLSPSPGLLDGLSTHATAKNGSRARLLLHTQALKVGRVKPSRPSALRRTRFPSWPRGIPLPQARPIFNVQACGLACFPLRQFPYIASLVPCPGPRSFKGLRSIADSGLIALVGVVVGRCYRQATISRAFCPFTRHSTREGVRQEASPRLETAFVLNGHACDWGAPR
jgi:hypothetical protein